MSTGRKNGRMYEIIKLNRNQTLIIEKLLEIGKSSVNALWKNHLKEKMAKDTFIKELKELETSPPYLVIMLKIVNC